MARKREERSVLGDHAFRVIGVLLSAALVSGCDEAASREAAAAGPVDYCEVPAFGSDVIAARPAEGDAPVDDVNWFARPVPHEGDDRILGFASHDQNYLYNITTGVRVRIPDRSDAVATPDGRYMTVPSYYTPDSNIRFYPIAPMLEALEAGRDIADLEPAFIHEHPAMSRVYYQSTGIVSSEATDAGDVTTYRLMFSGTGDESRFRIVDYRFTHDPGTGELRGVVPTGPMALCPIVTNDLNTPFISKDARYVAAYTTASSEPGYSPGASLKLFEITSTDPANGTTSCELIHDFGFAAGKADFSFDGSMLTFHISQGAYLTPFVNGGLDSGTITDVVVARLDHDASGDVLGASGLQRLTTSIESGVGSYFPAFFPDGTLFYIANAVPKGGNREKRFHFRVMDPSRSPWRRGVFATEESQAGWRTIATLWERSCATRLPALSETPFPLQAHEAPWLSLSLTAGQCGSLIDDMSADPAVAEAGGRDVLLELCSALDR
ncbi:MAG: hypothetical protein OEU54_05705 [Gemmatimonadota bacterium]|nr:hypothetical protein [Gemmatimonadota bacterium]